MAGGVLQPQNMQEPRPRAKKRKRGRKNAEWYHEQTTKQRRTVRGTLCHLNCVIQDGKKENTENDQAASSLLAQLDAVFDSDVRQTREAVLDADCLKTLTEYGIERARALGRGRSFNPSTFMSKLRHANLDPVSGDFRWEKLGSEVGVFFRSVPAVDHMCLDVEVQKKKQRTQTRKAERLDETKAIKPQRSKDSSSADGESDDVQTEAHTAMMIKKVAGVLTEASKEEPIDALKFVVDPESFSQTVENLFYTAFSVKQGQVSVDLDSSTGLPFLAKSQAPAMPDSQDELGEDDGTPNQFICTIDMATWRGLCENYSAIDKEESIIPHRTPPPGHCDAS